MNSQAKKYDFRIGIIERNFGEAFALYADRNLAGWVLDRLSDERPAALSGPLAEVRGCDAMFSSNPEWKVIADAAPVGQPIRAHAYNGPEAAPGPVWNEQRCLDCGLVRSSSLHDARWIGQPTPLEALYGADAESLPLAVLSAWRPR